MFNTLGSNSNPSSSRGRKLAPEDERYAFNLTYFDPQADLVRQYQLLYFTLDNTIEMYDIKQKRIFLKRSPSPGINLKDLHMGAVVNLHSRQMKIAEYADEFTRKKFEQAQQTTLAMIKPDGFGNMGHIIDAIYKDGFKIVNMGLFHLRKEDAEKFYAVHKGKPFYDNLVAFMSSGPITALELAAPDAIQKWRNLIGPTNTFKAREEAPNSLRARFGTDQTKNAVHGSDSPENARIEANFYFAKNDLENIAAFQDCSLGIIKPHAVAAGNAGEMIQMIIDSGFLISAMYLLTVEKMDAADFYEIYKGVVPEFKNMVDELSAGPCIVLEVRKESNAVEAFRQVCGPSDPDVAKLIRPGTIRARFGENRVQNAIHCTDLEEDGVLEVEFFFNILFNKK